MPGCDNAGTAKRSYPTSEVGGRSTEDPMPERRWPRGVTPRPRSGAAAESARLRRHRNSREELPKSEVGAAARRSYPTPEAGAVAERTNPTSMERWLHGHRRA